MNKGSRGPVPEEELKQRAVSGQLKPTDKVWKKGMANWQAALEIEGLIPDQDEPPPLPAEDEPPPLSTETFQQPTLH